MTNTSIVNSGNIEYMKSHIYNMVAYFNSTSRMLDEIELAMSQFTYENEKIETEVFRSLMVECNIDLFKLEKRYELLFD